MRSRRRVVGDPFSCSKNAIGILVQHCTTARKSTLFGRVLRGYVDPVGDKRAKVVE